MRKTRSFRIHGMDCAEEIAALRQTVGTLPGVDRLDFNLMSGLMSVTFPNGDPLADAAILQAVERAGLSAEPVTAPGGQIPAHDRQRARSLLCGLSGLSLAGGCLVQSLSNGGFLQALFSGNVAPPTPYPFAAGLFYAVSVASGIGLVLPKAASAIRRFRPDMNLLMTLAVAGAIAIGQWVEAATVSFLFAFSLLLESWSVSRARRAIRTLLDIVPSTARTVDPATGAAADLPPDRIPVGSIVRVRPGERIALDGVVTKGATTVNQAPITGESMPVRKEPGDDLFAGTINESDLIEFRVARPAGDSTLSRIIRLVEEAQSHRAPIEQWVETFARYYTPAMILSAVGVALLPPLFGGTDWGGWFYKALVLLVIACPCALVISTPISIVAALTLAARSGVLIKGGAFLEAAATIRTVALDKTGTVTRGHPEVQTIIPLNGHTIDELLTRAAALEAHSNHPLARAILRIAEVRPISIPHADPFRILPGKGAEGMIEGRRFWLGSSRLLQEEGITAPEILAQLAALEDQGHSVVAIGNDTHLCGLISIADTVRQEAAGAIRDLTSEGASHLVMLTGDNEGTARAVAQAVGIRDVRAQLMPQEKQRLVAELVANTGPTAMIGDGINDAPALASATIGIAMGTAGSDAAIETADIALMSDDLAKVPWLMRHARRTRSVIRQNIFFALGVKLLFMALAVAKRSTLWMAIAADMGASLIVIFNALRLLRPTASRSACAPEPPVHSP